MEQMKPLGDAEQAELKRLIAIKAWGMRYYELHNRAISQPKTDLFDDDQHIKG